MKTTAWMAKTSMVRAVVLGMALAPMGLMAQQGAAPDGQSAGQDQQGPMRHGGSPAERQQHMLKMLTKKLDLTPDQVSQVQGIQNDSLTQMQGLHADTSTAPADRHAKMMEIHKTEQDKIRAVLNDQQKAKFDQMVAHQQERMHDHQGDNAPPPQQ